MLDDLEAFARVTRGELRPVPISMEMAAMAAHATGASIFDSKNRRAAGWGRHSAMQMMRDANRKRRGRKAAKAARIARRKSRQ